MTKRSNKSWDINGKINAKLLILTNGTDTYCIEIDLKSKASYLKKFPPTEFFCTFNI